MEQTKTELLNVDHLVKQFAVQRSLLGKPTVLLNAVSDVNLTVYKGEVLGVVGESGCGKSTLGRTILQLEKPTSGHVYYNGQDLTALSGEQLRQMRRKLQIIFQDPYASLNPRMTIKELISAPLEAFQIGTKEEREQRVLHMMQLVGLDESYLYRYPHEFSGGQRQRIVIARALILRPEFVVCDEPVSALDVSVRSQVLNLMKQLQKELDLTCIFISHDLSVIKYICNRIAVMYLGHLVELADKDELYERPAHPYTKALLDAIPIPEANRSKQHTTLSGDVPSPINPPSGCVFHTRCPYAQERCSCEVPELRASVDGKRFCACHRAHELDPVQF